MKGCFTLSCVLSAGLVTGSLVLLAISLLQPYFCYIPKSSLAALVLVAVSGLLDLTVVKKIWKVRRIEVLPFFVAFLGCIYRLDMGILYGVSVSLLILFYPVAHPPVVERHGRIRTLRIDGELTFPGIEHIVVQIDKLVSQNPAPKEILLDFKTITTVDFTGLKGLLNIISDLESKSVKVHFIAVNNNISVMMACGGIDTRLINQQQVEMIECDAENVEMVVLYCTSV